MANLLNRLELGNKKILLVVFISLLIVYLDFNFLMKLQFQGLKQIGPKIIRLKKDIDNLTKDLAAMQDLKNKQIKTGQESILKAKKIISEERIPSLLQSISDVANRNKIKIIKILPSKELKTKEGKTPLGISKFTPILIMLDLSCSYHNLGKFINDLENTQEFMSVEDLKITRDPSNYFSQNVNLVLRTYVKK